MNRPSRSERSASNSKGRPKRRATTSYLFKYQLSGDPNRIEENALKKALQESLEEQSSATTDSFATAKKQNSKTGNIKGRAIINCSTNSSDVSKGSNSSSYTTTNSSGSRDLSIDNGSAINKRLRSTLALSVVTPSPPPSKRAKLTTNGHSYSNDNKNKKCDIDDTRVLAASPVPPFNRAIQKTYSRSQNQQSRKHNCNDTPRSSTPIVTPKRQASNSNVASVKNSSVSTSTQTINRAIVNLRNTTDDSKTLPEDLTSSKNQIQQKNIDKPNGANNQSSPVQHQYLKFKRESKNYAYAKMTALKVNTGKSYYMGISKSSSSGSKKSSPNGVLNINNINKNQSKTSPKNALKLNATKSRLAAVENEHGLNSGKTSPSSSKATKNTRHLDKSTYRTKVVSNSFQGPTTTAKIDILKVNSNSTPQEVKDDRSTNHTLDLSKNQNQANLSVSKKRIAQGSWLLIGVPEEKMLYIRDDEHPKRLICYPAIRHIEGDVIQVRDSVLLRSGAKQTDLPYIAKVCAFWEDAETGGVMMSLFWYYRPEHIEEGRKPHHLFDEIFASRHRDADSVECIEDKCYVLTFNEYCRYRKRCKMEQVNTSWSLTDVTIPVSNESYPRRSRIPDSNVNPELVFCCRQIYDSRNKRLVKNPLINPKYGNI